MRLSTVRWWAIRVAGFLLPWWSMVLAAWAVIADLGAGPLGLVTATAAAGGAGLAGLLFYMIGVEWAGERPARRTAP